jgi:hypothetical protein
MKDENTPSKMKTVENPATKAEELISVSLRINALSPLLKSSKDIPVINDT